jgi:2-keto-4-pentenoate hydratase
MDGMGISIKEKTMYIDIPTIIAALASVATVVYGYLFYRRSEVVDLAFEIIEAYEDKNVTEEEFGEIVERLKKVIYKK